MTDPIELTASELERVAALLENPPRPAPALVRDFAALRERYEALGVPADLLGAPSTVLARFVARTSTSRVADLYGMRTYLIADESRFDGLNEATAARVAYEERHGFREPAMVLVSWADLAEANDLETMEEVAHMNVGEARILGMCDPIERVS